MPNKLNRRALSNMLKSVLFSIYLWIGKTILSWCSVLEYRQFIMQLLDFRSFYSWIIVSAITRWISERKTLNINFKLNFLSIYLLFFVHGVKIQRTLQRIRMSVIMQIKNKTYSIWDILCLLQMSYRRCYTIWFLELLFSYFSCWPLNSIQLPPRMISIIE